MRQKFKLLAEKFSEAWTACMVCMVQGDLTVISLQHAFTASKTGILAGIGMVIASYFPWKNKWIGIFLTGLITMLADYICGWSPTVVGPIVTGLGAMSIALVYDKIKGRHNAT